MTDARRDILSITPLLLTPYRSLVEIGTNYAGAETELDMASGVLNFDMDTAGRRAIDLIVTDIQRNFNGKIWSQNGPNVILRVLQSLCGTKHVSMGSLTDCLYIQWRPLIIIADNVINQLLLSKSVVPKHSI